MNLTRMPGGDLIVRGLDDQSRGEESMEALLVAIGAPRLRRLGIPVSDVPSAEHRLYELLARTDPDSAHGRYNALLRRLASFVRAMECGA